MMRYNFLKNFAGSQESLDIIGRSFPVKRLHREIIVFSAVNSKLLFKIIEGIKTVGSIEVFVIFSVRTFDFAVMTWCIRSYEFMLYPTLFEASLKQCGSAAVDRKKPLCKFCSIVCLNTFNRKRERFYQVFKKQCRTISAMFLEGFQVSET